MNFKTSIILVLGFIVFISTSHAGTSCAQFYQNSKVTKLHPKVEALVLLGYSESIASRYLKFKGELFVNRLLEEKIEPILVFRGVNTNVENYDPIYRDGAMLRVGNLWVTQKKSVAEGFTKGVLLTYQVPSTFGNQRVFEADKVTIERMFLDRFNEVRDDRVFMESLYVPSMNRSFSYEEAIEAGIIKPLTDD